MTALVHLHLGAFIHIAVQRLVGLVCTVCHLIAHKLIIDALSIRAGKLPGFAGTVRLLCTAHLVRLIATVVLAVTSIHIADALEILAGELGRGASLVFVVAELALVGSVTTIVVVIA